MFQNMLEARRCLKLSRTKLSHSWTFRTAKLQKPNIFLDLITTADSKLIQLPKQKTMKRNPKTLNKEIQLKEMRKTRILKSLRGHLKDKEKISNRSGKLFDSEY
jgi:hypothetical protein